MESVTIKSSSSGNTLRLSNPKPSGSRYPVESICVELRGREIAASSSQVYLYQPYDLVDFFEDLARHWKGWEGEKRWCTVEDNFVLSATSDSLGHVSLGVTLRSGPFDEDWTVETAVTIDSGQLENVAGEIKRFLHAGGGAWSPRTGVPRIYETHYFTR